MRRIKNTLVYNVFLICLTGVAAPPILGQDTSTESVQQTAEEKKKPSLEGSWIWYGPAGVGELTFYKGGQTFQLIGNDGSKRFKFKTKIETSEHDGVCFLVHRNEEGEITYRGIYKLTDEHFYEIPPSIQADRRGAPDVRDWRRAGADIDSWLKAARDGNTEKIKQMLKDGMNPDATVNYSLTALSYAAAGGHTATMEFLIKHGADVGIRSGWWGSSATDVAAKHHKQKSLELLKKHGASFETCQNLGHAKIKIYYGNGPVHELAHSGRSDVLDYLLKQGANIDARNLNGVTPLMIAVLRSRKRNGELSPQHADIVKTLLAKGADPNSKNKDGKTAIDLAEERDLEDIVTLLNQ